VTALKRKRELNEKRKLNGKREKEESLFPAER
jgi:hypothetical protein